MILCSSRAPVVYPNETVISCSLPFGSPHDVHVHVDSDEQGIVFVLTWSDR